MQMTFKRQWVRWAATGAVGLLLAGPSPSEQGQSRRVGPFPQPWINGTLATEPALQVQR